MFNPDKIFKGTSKKKGKDLFDMDNFFPKKKLEPERQEDQTEKIVKEATKKGKNVIINNYYQMPQMKQQMPMVRVKKQRKRMNLTTLNGELFNDDDKDGYPNYMDPQPNNPNVPKKKMIYEKALQSIYRSDKDE